GRNRSIGPHRRSGGAASAAGRAAIARSQSAARRRRSSGAGSMMRALHLLFIAVGAAGGATAVDPATHETPAMTAALGLGRPGRPGADSTRVAAWRTALGTTDPVPCALIAD